MIAFVVCMFNVAIWLLLLSFHSQAANGLQLQIAIDPILQKARDMRLWEDPVWAALLHFSEGAPQILDNGFLLSAPKFSLEHELVITLKLLYEMQSPSVLCRFPARYRWLQAKLSAPVLHLDECSDLSEFIQKAPADQISLVYASENLTQPSSMMGHLLIKISGKNNKGQLVNHAISFYTNTGTINLPKLFYDSMIVGKKGYFVLSPYAKKLNLYNKQEQRNVYEYKLNISDFKLRLIHYHLLELKNTKLIYYFHKYNCATLVNFILSIAAPSMREPTGLWITPLDVIKQINASGIVKETLIHPSSRWAVRTLIEQMPTAISQKIKQQVDDRESDLSIQYESKEQQFMGLELASAYNDYLYEQSSLTRLDWLSYSNNLNSTKRAHFSELDIDTSNYKNPLLVPQDSQIFAGFSQINEITFLKIGFLPASHLLEDDNRQYFGESELRLFELTLLSRLDRTDLRIDNLQIYSAQSLIPYNSFVGGISGRVHVAIEPQFDSQLEKKNALVMGGAVGLSGYVSRDFDIYGLIGAGIGWGNNKIYGYLNPEIGIIVREVFDMKSVISIVNNRNQLGDQSSFYEFRFVQSKPISKNLSLVFEYNAINNGISVIHSFDFLIKKFF